MQMLGWFEARKAAGAVCEERLPHRARRCRPRLLSTAKGGRLFTLAYAIRHCPTLETILLESSRIEVFIREFDYVQSDFQNGSCRDCRGAGGMRSGLQGAMARQGFRRASRRIFGEPPALCGAAGSGAGCRAGCGCTARTGRHVILEPGGIDPRRRRIKGSRRRPADRSRAGARGEPSGRFDGASHHRSGHRAGSGHPGRGAIHVRKRSGPQPGGQERASDQSSLTGAKAPFCHREI